MSPEASSKLFEYLDGRKFSKATCILWRNGQREVRTGILTDIVPFQHIVLDNDTKNAIPFVGYGTLIEEIIMEGRDKTPHSIYKNTDVRGYDFTELKTSSKVALAQRNLMGYSPILDDAAKNPLERDVHLGRRR